MIAHPPHISLCPCILAAGYLEFWTETQSAVWISGVPEQVQLGLLCGSNGFIQVSKISRLRNCLQCVK